MSADTIRSTKFALGDRHTKILLVDEDPGELRTLSTVLKGQGFVVSSCNTYDDAVKRIEAEVFDLVIVSQGTHRFEGRKVLVRAMQLNRERPVVVLTRYIDMECYLEAMQMGAVDYLEMPVPPSDLAHFVRTHTGFAATHVRRAAV
jgi:DNA-binding NtrC family response regulator